MVFSWILSVEVGSEEFEESFAEAPPSQDLITYKTTITRKKARDLIYKICADDCGKSIDMSVKESSPWRKGFYSDLQDNKGVNLFGLQLFLYYGKLGMIRVVKREGWCFTK